MAKKTQKNIETREQMEPELAASMLYYDQEEFHAFMKFYRAIESDKELAPIGPFASFIKYMNTIFKYAKKQNEELSVNYIMMQLKQCNMSNPDSKSREQFDLWLQEVEIKNSAIIVELAEDLFNKYLWLTFMDKVAYVNKSKIPYDQKLLIRPIKVELSEEAETFIDIQNIMVDGDEERMSYTTGISDLDEYIKPKRSNFMVVAARPGVGKSIFMLQMALENAKRGVKSLFISMEMTPVQIKERIMKWYADNQDVTYKNWEDLEKQSSYAQIMKNLTIVNGAGKSAELILDITEEAVEERGFEIIFIDYLQITRFSNSKDEWDSLRQLTFKLKMLASSKSILMVSCSQVSREASKYGIELSSLFGSSTIENDTDIVLGLESTETGNNLMDDPTANMKIKILKNRQGIVNKNIDQELNRATMKFTTKF